MFPHLLISLFTISVIIWVVITGRICLVIILHVMPALTQRKLLKIIKSVSIGLSGQCSWINSMMLWKIIKKSLIKRNEKQKINIKIVQKKISLHYILIHISPYTSFFCVCNHLLDKNLWSWIQKKRSFPIWPIIKPVIAKINILVMIQKKYLRWESLKKWRHLSVYISHNFYKAPMSE